MGLFTTTNMRNGITTEQANKIIKNQQEIRDLFKKILTRIDLGDSKTMDMVGHACDKLDRMFPEDSELFYDGKDY
jgi:hypothetical protein